MQPFDVPVIWLQNGPLESNLRLALMPFLAQIPPPSDRFNLRVPFRVTVDPCDSLA